MSRHRRDYRPSLVAAAWLVTGLFCCTAATASSVDRCLAVANAPGLIQPAAYVSTALKSTEARLTFVGHSTFLIESPGGIRIATDYNDYIRPPVVPDIATMNRAHTSHFTDRPDAGIKHVLRGWDTAGGAARHDLEVSDVRVRNVVTNIRDWSGGTQLYANSIFVFEVGGLCIGHLGHLHHTLTPEHLAQIGQLDVALVPVDGSYTLDIPGMVEVVKNLRARLIIPMHYFGAATLARFLDRVKGDFEIKESLAASVTVSRATLPASPRVLVLPGA